MTRRLLFLTKGTATNPASRYRFLQYIPYLERQGFDVSVYPLLSESYYHLSEIRNRTQRLGVKSVLAAQGFIRRLLHLPLLRRADLVLLENQVFPYEPGLLELLARSINPKLVVEFDDAIYRTPLHRGKLLRSLSAAHHVIVGNAELERFALHATKRVSVVPTVVDTSRYPITPYEPDLLRPVRIGWIGLPSGFGFLDRMRGVLRETARRVPIEFHVISALPWTTPDVDCRFIPWSEDGEIQALADIDIGIMPLPDTAWARGKCGLKLLQYLAAGRAAVASPVGVNARIITHDETGLLAQSDREWVESLTRLAKNPALRRRLGEGGRERVRRDYSLEAWAPRVAELYDRLIQTPATQGGICEATGDVQGKV